jgi:hypothetical protein
METADCVGTTNNGKPRVEKPAAERFKPIVYVPREPLEDQLMEVLVEENKEYSVLWYHWPHDDYTGKEDYEPVVLFHPGGGLRAIGIRPHKEYRLSTRWLAEGARPIIVFTTAWHGAIVFQGKTSDVLTSAFMNRAVSIIKEDYDLIAGRPPEWYVKDGTDTSVYDFAADVLTRM